MKDVYEHISEHFVGYKRPCKDKIEFILKENAFMDRKMTQIFLFDKELEMSK